MDFFFLFLNQTIYFQISDHYIPEGTHLYKRHGVNPVRT